ncbi:hypothetical protein BC828DRAFT_404093 [Blastocladiella britannica]|nr:hypothetical protein BC828DRAFT_404093 [Blastocladiella britannica]
MHPKMLPLRPQSAATTNYPQRWSAHPPPPLLLPPPPLLPLPTLPTLPTLQSPPSKEKPLTTDDQLRYALHELVCGERDYARHLTALAKTLPAFLERVHGWADHFAASRPHTHATLEPADLVLAIRSLPDLVRLHSALARALSDAESANPNPVAAAHHAALAFLDTVRASHPRAAAAYAEYCGPHAEAMAGWARALDALTWIAPLGAPPAVTPAAIVADQFVAPVLAAAAAPGQQHGDDDNDHDVACSDEHCERGPVARAARHVRSSAEALLALPVQRITRYQLLWDAVAHALVRTVPNAHSVAIPAVDRAAAVARDLALAVDAARSQYEARSRASAFWAAATLAPLVTSSVSPPFSSIAPGGGGSGAGYSRPISMASWASSSRPSAEADISHQHPPLRPPSRPPSRSRDHERERRALSNPPPPPPRAASPFDGFVAAPNGGSTLPRTGGLAATVLHAALDAQMPDHRATLAHLVRAGSAAAEASMARWWRVVRVSSSLGTHAAGRTSRWDASEASLTPLEFGSPDGPDQLRLVLASGLSMEAAISFVDCGDSDPNSDNRAATLPRLTRAATSLSLAGLGQGHRGSFLLGGSKSVVDMPTLALADAVARRSPAAANATTGLRPFSLALSSASLTSLAGIAALDAAEIHERAHAAIFATMPPLPRPLPPPTEASSMDASPNKRRATSQPPPVLTRFATLDRIPPPPPQLTIDTLIPQTSSSGTADMSEWPTLDSMQSYDSGIVSSRTPPAAATLPQMPSPPNTATTVTSGTMVHYFGLFLFSDGLLVAALPASPGSKRKGSGESIHPPEQRQQHQVRFAWQLQDTRARVYELPVDNKGPNGAKRYGFRLALSGESSVDFFARSKHTRNAWLKELYLIIQGTAPTRVDDATSSPYGTHRARSAASMSLYSSNASLGSPTMSLLTHSPIATPLNSPPMVGLCRVPAGSGSGAVQDSGTMLDMRAPLRYTPPNSPSLAPLVLPMPAISLDSPSSPTTTTPPGAFVNPTFWEIPFAPANTQSMTLPRSSSLAPWSGTADVDNTSGIVFGLPEKMDAAPQSAAASAKSKRASRMWQGIARAVTLRRPNSNDATNASTARSGWEGAAQVDLAFAQLFSYIPARAVPPPQTPPPLQHAEHGPSLDLALQQPPPVPSFNRHALSVRGHDDDETAAAAALARIASAVDLALKQYGEPLPMIHPMSPPPPPPAPAPVSALVPAASPPRPQQLGAEYGVPLAVPVEHISELPTSSAVTPPAAWDDLFSRDSDDAEEEDEEDDGILLTLGGRSRPDVPTAAPPKPSPRPTKLVSVPPRSSSFSSSSMSSPATSTVRLGAGSAVGSSRMSVLVAQQRAVTTVAAPARRDSLAFDADRAAFLPWPTLSSSARGPSSVQSELIRPRTATHGPSLLSVTESVQAELVVGLVPQPPPVPPKSARHSRRLGLLQQQQSAGVAEAPRPRAGTMPAVMPQRELDERSHLEIGSPMKTAAAPPPPPPASISGSKSGGGGLRRTMAKWRDSWRSSNWDMTLTRSNASTGSVLSRSNMSTTSSRAYTSQQL